MPSDANTHLIEGVKIVSLSINAPGPVAASRLAEMGADVVKVEPPAGDPLKIAAPAWYASLCRRQTVMTLDLKDSSQRQRLDDLLGRSNLLMASFRPSALRRLGLDWESLHARHPRLCLAGIIGHPPPQEEQTGHDLTYLADTGLLSPPGLPLSLYVDLAGAERCVSMSLALLLSFARTGQPGYGFISLYECAQGLAQPLQAGLTVPGTGVLGGGSAFYGMYQSSDGWIAVAALEPHFAKKLTAELGLASANHAELKRVFITRTAQAWQAWAAERDLPLMAIHATKLS